MRVGIPWISLDSLVRIETFQWVTRVFRRKNFLTASSPEAANRWNERLRFGHAEAQDCSSGKPNLISDFLQENVGFYRDSC
jgi:hypothetical protein